MKTVLIYGIDTVAGANLACSLRSQAQLIGAADQQAPELIDCQILTGQAATADPRRLLADLRPDYVIDASCCGDSPWNPQAEIGQEDQCQAVRERANACHELGVPFALLSCDAVLTGPWMFHEETATDCCGSILAQRLLQLEQTVQELCPGALIVRTHLFGWNPLQAGWIETLVERMQVGKICSELNQPGYATPVLASQVAEVVWQALEAGLTGVYHVAGAERVNRVQFARRLAETFQLTRLRMPLSESHFSQAERKNFACGEMSLQTRAIRRALGVAMPTLTESLEELAAQQHNGYTQRLLGQPRVSLSRAA